jgi:hypothetical protein
MRFLFLFLGILFTLVPLEAQTSVPIDSAKSSKEVIPAEEEPKLIGGRYIFMQSGFPVEKKTLQYQNLNGLLNDVQYGILDDLSMAAGVVLPFYAYLSVQYTKEVAPLQRLVIGDIAATSMFLDDDASMRSNMLYAGYTYGTTDNHATAALGWLSTNLLPSSDLFLQLGGCKKITKGIYLMGEFWYSSGYQQQKGVSQWVRDAVGNPVLVDPTNPLGSAYKLKYVDKTIDRHSLYANVQLRLISTKNSNKSWSFGLMYFANWGGSYQEQGAYGEIRNLNNIFVLPMPSVSFIQRIGDFRPPPIPIRPTYLEIGL